MNKKKILIIDDETAITKLLKLVLEQSGRYEVRCENEGGKVFAAAKSFMPDLLILDVNLPDIQGGELSAMLQQDAVLKNIPIVFLTGMASREETQAGLTITGHSVVAKPIDIEQLIECIEKNLAV